jgi:uncharacterized protein
MELGKTQVLKASRTTDNGCYLMDEVGNEVLLPNAYVSSELKLGDDISVFVYKDNDQRLTATTLKPKVELEQFAFLEVMDVNAAGAFVDMGIVKQLLVPYSEQPVKMDVGDWYVVFFMLDDVSDRLIGSANIEDFLFTEDLDIEVGEEVDILMYRRSDLGINAIVNGLYQGLVFHSDVHRPARPGDQMKAYVKNIRADGKIDLSLQPMGYRNVIDKATQSVLDVLIKNEGFFKYSDKSNPDEIYKAFKMSKKAFKKALGSLYKQKIVLLEKDGTRLLKGKGSSN